MTVIWEGGFLTSLQRWESLSTSRKGSRNSWEGLITSWKGLRASWEGLRWWYQNTCFISIATTLWHNNLSKIWVWYQYKTVRGCLAMCFWVYKTCRMIWIPILHDGGDKQCHQLPNCYQFLPKKSSQTEALYCWVFPQVKRHHQVYCNIKRFEFGTTHNQQLGAGRHSHQG